MKILIHCFSNKLLTGENPKNYPYWDELLELLKDNEIIQIGVNDDKQLVRDYRKNLPLKEIKKLVEWSDIGIDIDSFLQHLYWYMNKKCFVIFGQSDPLIFGHKENVNILKDRKYLRPNQFWKWEQCTYMKECFLEPNLVHNIIKKEA